MSCLCLGKPLETRRLPCAVRFDKHPLDRSPPNSKPLSDPESLHNKKVCGRRSTQGPGEPGGVRLLFQAEPLLWHTLLVAMPCRNAWENDAAGNFLSTMAASYACCCGSHAYRQEEFSGRTPPQGSFDSAAAQVAEIVCPFRHVGPARLSKETCSKPPK